MTQETVPQESVPQAGSFQARTDFVRAHTVLLAPPLVPEIRLHLAHEAVPLWMKTEDELNAAGLPPPFWAFAWAGGQALARHVLDHPDMVAGKNVLDLASGSGLVAIAAMQAGARTCLAADIDSFAHAAQALNAQANDVVMSSTQDDLLLEDPPLVDVILVGDLFYDRAIATRLYEWLRAAPGIVYIGDPGRSFLPHDRLRKIASYGVPVSRDLEDCEIKQTAVWMLA